MDTEIMLQILKDADLEGDVLCFCKGFRGYQQAKAEAGVWYGKVKELLGEQALLQFEAAISHYYSWEAKAYYAFGLRLRDELKQALML